MAFFLFQRFVMRKAYGALGERELRVPDDMSVVGFGDLPEPLGRPGKSTA
ncbi:hypothetical protein [Streptomyces sp. NPDC001851]